jgi:hypothetical protein
MTFYIRLAFTSGPALRIKGAAYFTKSQRSETDNTMKSLQLPLLVLSQQRCEVKNLVSKLCSGIGICLVAEDRSFEAWEMTEWFHAGEILVKILINQ